MSGRRTALRVIVSTVFAIPLWLGMQNPIGWTVRGVAMVAMRAVGEQPHVVDADQVGIIVRQSATGQLHTRVFSVTLMRWHANLVALLVIGISFGTLTFRQRVLVCVAGALLLVFLDGVTVFAYLSAAAYRLGGDVLLTPSIHQTVETALAVYAVKFLPVVVWLALYVAVKRPGLRLWLSPRTSIGVPRSERRRRRRDVERKHQRSLASPRSSALVRGPAPDR